MAQNWQGVLRHSPTWHQAPTLLRGATNNLPTWKAQVRKGPRGEGTLTKKSTRTLGTFLTWAFQVGRLLVAPRRGVGAWCQVGECLSTPCQFCAILSHSLTDCIRSGYVGGQLVITRNMTEVYLHSTRKDKDELPGCVYVHSMGI